MAMSDYEKRGGKPRICVISSVAYLVLHPELQGTGLGNVGGSALQVAWLSKALVKEGFDVSLVTGDYGQKPLEIIDDIEILKGPPRRTGLKQLFSWLFSTWKALDRADADIYYPRAMAHGGTISFYCFLKRKKLVHPIDSDTRVRKRHFTLSEWRGWLSDYLARLDIRFADVVIVQTEYQKDLLRKHFRKDGIVVRSIYPLLASIPIKSQPPVVLWVANLTKVKQAELFLKLAEAIPEVKFQMIGGVGEDLTFYELMEKKASKISNLEFLGFVPNPETNQYFDKASVFVNTSTVEGFPNTFLEAWARCIPVVSLHVDPDEVICKNQLGLHSKTFDQMVRDVKLLLTNRKLRETMGLNGRKYVKKEHDANRVATEYKKILLDLIIKE